VPDEELVVQIKVLIGELPICGYRRVHAVLKRQALAAGLEPANHTRIYRVMKAHGLLLDRHAGGVERRHDAASQSMSAIGAGVPTASRSPFSTKFLQHPTSEGPRRNDHDQHGNAAHERCAYSDIPSLSSQSAISCTAAHSPAHVAMLRWNTIRTEGARPFRRRRSATGIRTTSAPAGPLGPHAPVRGALRAKTAPAASESPTQGRQFSADETPMPGERRRLGLEGSL